MTPEQLTAAGCPSSTGECSQKQHIPYTHHAGAEHLTLALVSLLPKHAPGQEKTRTRFNGRNTVILQIVYRRQSQNAGGSQIISSHGRAAQQQWCNPAQGCESTGKHCTAHRAGCQHACIPHIPPHSRFSNTSLCYNTHHTHQTDPSSPHPVIISPTPYSFETYLSFSPCFSYFSLCITSHLSDGFSVLRNSL